MKAFTEPLIAKIYGGENLQLNSFDDVLSLFSDPDVTKVRARLDAMAKELKIDLMEVPHFLEDFGDVFLSLSCYRSCMDQVEPIVDEFSESIEDLKKSYQFKNNALLMFHRRWGLPVHQWHRAVHQDQMRRLRRLDVEHV